ncbi:SOS response-associated peptidase family protein [Cognatilysobacter terrigena]|uniref:SOS response-associated peptidase family protein n=1 Tax=Cognatilysobacter terrigena TaxID=2488749 RepID=UPI001060DD2E|nr:SOS response-associated peptidase family protein [Lysobacter terrigena]
MCFSAQCWQAFNAYVKEFGDVIDIHEFAQLYGFRKEPRKSKAAPKIPKGMDRNFDYPKTPIERQIKAMIDEWNAQQISAQERELFKQVKRLNDAERTLQTKTTKKALDDQRIATSKIALIKAKLADIKRTEAKPQKDDRIFPGVYAPVLIVENGKRVLRPMRYQCRVCGKPASHDAKYPGTYTARRDSLEGYWRSTFGQSHGLMVVERFYENVEGPDGKNRVLEFRPRTGEPMYVACLWSKWTDPKGEEPDLYSFAAITDEPEAEVAAAGHDRTIVNLKPEYVDAWLNPQGRSLGEFYAMFDDRRHPFYEHREAA